MTTRIGAMFVFLPMTLALPAWGQAAVTGREGQAVTLEDLEGVAVDATTVRQQVGRRNGGPIFSRRVQNDVRLIIRSGKIDWSLTPSAFTPSGIRRGKPRSGSLMIERSGKLDDFSGRDFAVWVFNEGTLTFLRTRGSGATKRDITFTRTAEGLTCVAKDGFVRENGNRPLIIESGIAGGRVTLISWKLVSSTCRVTRQPEQLSK